MPHSDDRPAIAGGTPIRTDPWPTPPPRYGAEELRELEEALAQGTLFGPAGTKVRAFEAAFAEMVGVPFAVACSSGTAAIHAALACAGISPGDEVITTPITDMGTVAPILFQGAVPIFADVDYETANLDPKSVAERITERTRAVIAVHLAGNPCDLDALSALCAERGVVLIEDCAQAMGALWRGRWVGTWGDYGCFSLNEFKHISCGDGGIVIARDPAVADKLRQATDKAYNRKPGATAAERNPSFLANNYRMTELQGAVALAQLRKLPGILERRRHPESRLASTAAAWGPYPIEATAHYGAPAWVDRPALPSWWLQMAMFPGELADDTGPARFAEAVRAEGIPMGAGYIPTPIYLYPVLAAHAAFLGLGHAYERARYEEGLCPVAESVLRDCILLGWNDGCGEREEDEVRRAVCRTAYWLHLRWHERVDPVVGWSQDALLSEAVGGRVGERFVGLDSVEGMPRDELEEGARQVLARPQAAEFVPGARPLSRRLLAAQWTAVLDSRNLPSKPDVLELCAGGSDPVVVALDVLFGHDARYVTVNLNRKLADELRARLSGLTIDWEIVEDDARNLLRLFPEPSFDCVCFHHAVNDILQTAVSEARGLDTRTVDWWPTERQMIEWLDEQHRADGLQSLGIPELRAIIESAAKVVRPGGSLVFDHWTWEHHLSLDWFPGELFNNLMPLAREVALTCSEPLEEITPEPLDRRWWMVLRRPV